MVPVYWAGNDVEEFRHGRANVARLSLATVSNIPRGSPLLWLPFFATLAFSAICCWLLTIHCQAYVVLRMAFFECLDGYSSHAAAPGSVTAPKDPSTQHAAAATDDGIRGGRRETGDGRHAGSEVVWANLVAALNPFKVWCSICGCCVVSVNVWPRVLLFWQGASPKNHISCRL